MLKRPTLIAACAAVLLLVVSRAGHADSDEARARAFIESVADKAIAALTIKDIPHNERARRFRVLLNDHFAVKTIGRWVLGPHWRRATKEERQEYLSLFEDLLVDTYAERFQRYSGETLSVTNSATRSQNDSIVYTLITRPGGGPIHVDWRVRASGEKQRIVDVIVEGVSMGMTQRSEFSSVIGSRGGGVKGLLDELRKRRKKAREDA
jgi:phospholipid transport system substrate-binding protein